MSYQLVWRQRPEEVVAASESTMDALAEMIATAESGLDEVIASPAFGALLERNQEIETKDPSFLSLSGPAMGQLRAVLVARAMAYDSAPIAEPPDPARYAVTEERLMTALSASVDPTLASQLAANELAFVDALDAHDASRTPGLGIALHKLCSSDRWIVTPAECREALEAATPNATPAPDLFDDLLDFLRGAAAHGGFVVL